MTWFVIAMTPLLLLAPNLICGRAAQSRDGSVGSEVQRIKKTDGEAVSIEFREFFEPGTGPLKPSARLLGLNGRRVRLIGFMAQLEAPPDGAFYLCSRPVQADESGGGTGDLPVDTVRVTVRSAKGKKIPFIARAIEITGILEIGPQAEADGTVSSIRLLLDASREDGRSANPSSPAIKRESINKTSIKHQRRK
jgi:hypothetical protein